MSNVSHRHRRLLVVVVAVTAVSGAWMTIAATLGSWVWYDDEGYVMLSLRGFLRGEPLYTGVYSQYGPFYYIARWPLHGLLGVPLSHDFTRLWSAAEWCLTALLAGLLVRRISRSGWTGLWAAALLLPYLHVVAKEPGHPQQLCSILCLILLHALVRVGARRRLLPWCATAGVVAGCLLLTKINVGVSVGAGAFLALTLALESSTARRWLLVPVTVGVSALPWLLVGSAGAAEGWTFAGVLSATTVAVALVTSRSELAPRFLCPRALVAFGGGALVAGGLVLAATLATGTRIDDLVRALVLRPRDVAALLAPSFRFPWLASVGAVAALGTALLYLRRSRRSGRETTSSTGLAWAKLVWGGGAAGLVSLDLLARYDQVPSFGPELVGRAEWILAWFLPFAWLGIAGRPRVDGDGGGTFARVLLAAVSPSLALIAYPVSCSQVACGTIPLLALAVITANDGLTLLASKPGRSPSVSRRVISIAASSLVLAFVLKTAFLGSRYLGNPRLDLAGARLLRIPEVHSAPIRGVVHELRQNADTFYTIYGFCSLYFWTELDPPTWFNATAWQFLLDEREQRLTVEALQAAEKPWLVWHTGFNFWEERLMVDPAAPLGRHLAEEFEPVGDIAPFRLYQRRQGD